MNVYEAIALLREHHEEVPCQRPLPTEEEVKAAESDLGFTFPDEFRVFHLTASNLVVGLLEPGVVQRDAMNYINLRHLAQRGWARGIARDRLPFCEDNGDFFCALSNGRVTLWMHEEESERPSANSFAEWITDVWIGQYTFNQ